MVPPCVDSAPSLIRGAGTLVCALDLSSVGHGESRSGRYLAVGSADELHHIWGTLGARLRATRVEVEGSRDEDNNNPALRSEHPPVSSFEVFSALWSNWRRAANPLFSN